MPSEFPARQRRRVAAAQGKRNRLPDVGKASGREGILPSFAWNKSRSALVLLRILDSKPGPLWSEGVSPSFAPKARAIVRRLCTARLAARARQDALAPERHSLRCRTGAVFPVGRRPGVLGGPENSHGTNRVTRWCFCQFSTRSRGLWSEGVSPSFALKARASVRCPRTARLVVARARARCPRPQGPRPKAPLRVRSRTSLYIHAPIVEHIRHSMFCRVRSTTP